MPLLHQLGSIPKEAFQSASNSIYIQLFFQVRSGPHEHEIAEFGPRQFDYVRPTDQGVKYGHD
jgi:hypothetical protein